MEKQFEIFETLKIASVVICVMLMRSGSEVIQLFSFSTKLSITLIMLINVKKNCWHFNIY